MDFKLHLSIFYCTLSQVIDVVQDFNFLVISCAFIVIELNDELELVFKCCG